MNGPNLTMLDRLNQAVNCHIIASGGVASLLDIVSIYDLGLYGAIARQVPVHRGPWTCAPPSSPAIRSPASGPPAICPRTSWTCTSSSPT